MRDPPGILPNHRPLSKKRLFGWWTTSRPLISACCVENFPTKGNRLHVHLVPVAVFDSVSNCQSNNDEEDIEGIDGGATVSFCCFLPLCDTTCALLMLHRLFFLFVPLIERLPGGPAVSASSHLISSFIFGCIHG